MESAVHATNPTLIILRIRVDSYRLFTIVVSYVRGKVR